MINKFLFIVDTGSPADLHGMWFPSVRRTLLCLSKLHRCLDKAIFQGLSQEALIACIANVSLSAQAISSKKVYTHLSFDLVDEMQTDWIREIFIFD